MVKEFPKSLRTDIILTINGKFCQQVKLFQQSKEDFIEAILLKMHPMICLAGDYIVRKGEIAESMYFIKKGIVKILCADNENMVIAFMDKGLYFGEIGALVTGKRSCSVVAHTDCVLFEISKDDLTELLKYYPAHRVFLESVGRQRLQTTNSMDLIQVSDDEDEKTVLQNATLIQATIKVPDSAPVKKENYWYQAHLIVMVLSVMWQIIYIPYAIAFYDHLEEAHPFVIIMEILSYIVFVIDIFVQLIPELRYFL